ncbi:MAG TPA: TetR/AcrR family transcriptional regulator [Azospirillum sp.]|nr:TetR/AcrR family transcriptional regulator [Azospirillum sp.]
MTAVVPPSPEAGSKPAQILEAASRLFLEHGYGAVSMDTVAKTANVSKATLYAHFRSKDELFAAMVAGECRAHMSALSCEEVSRMEVEEVLRQIGLRFLGMLTSPKALAGFRMVVAEAHRFPELARAFYESGPARSLAQMTAVLTEADRRGKLSVPDPRLAAEQFLGMLKADAHLRMMLCLQDPPSGADRERIVDSAVRLFTRGYAPEEK